MADHFEHQEASPPKADTVRVAVRVRPLNAREKSISTDARFSWKVDSSSVAQCDNNKVLQQNIYTFDNVFEHNTTNSQIFDTVAAPVVKSTVDGMNGVIFAYGQTAAGKTYTMLGTEADPGVTRRAIARVFDHVQEQTNRQFLLRASYIEIYNEVIRDLLVPGNENLKIHEDVFNKRVFVDAREEVVMSVDQVMNIIAAGEKAREVGETNMNERSSRSHTIFSLKIESREIEPDAEQDAIAMESNGVALRSSTLSLVDLAGSERASFTKAQGQRLVEGGYINKSLLTLGTVINKLSSGVTLSSGHIPYRDSKLTRLLQPALGGNARTSIICAVTPAVLHMDETISTLKFASRAKKVTNMAKANEYLDDRAKLRKAEKKITVMRAELQFLRANGRTSNTSTQASGERLSSSQLNGAGRVQAFEKMWNRIIDKIPAQEVKAARRSEGSRPAPLKEYKRPSLTSALDLCTGRVSDSSDGNRDEVIDDELAELRKKVMNAEKEKRQALSEIEYERQAMSDELQLLVAGSEEATMGRMAAEQDCDRAISLLAKAQSRSLVDEIVSHAVTKSEVSKDLKTAQRKLVTMDKIRKENQTVKETLVGLRREHADAMRREKRGIGPVLKEAKLAQNKVNDLESKLRGARQSSQKLASERASLEREVKDRDRKIKVLTSEVERHRRHDERVQHRIREEVAEEKKKFDSVLDKFKANLSVQLEKVEKLEKEVESAQTKIEELQAQEKKNCAELALKTAEVQKLQEYVLQNENENQRILKVSEAQSAELEGVQTRLKEIEKDRDSLECYRTKLEEENVRKGDDLAKKVEELARVCLELEETQSELDCVQKDRQEVKEQVQTVQLSLKEAESRCSTTLRTTEELQNELEKRKHGLQEAQEKMSGLEARLEKMVELEGSLTEAQESVHKMNEQLSEKRACEEASQKQITDLQTTLVERSQNLESLQDRLSKTGEEHKRLESETQAATARHDQLLRIVAELERVNGELMKKDCETCAQLEKQLAAVQLTNANGAAAVHQEIAVLQSQNDELNVSLEQLTVETATRTRELERLTKTLRNRDKKLYNAERTLEEINRGEGIVGKLNDRIQRREMQIGTLNRQLEAQTELLENGALSEKFADAQRICAIQSENHDLRNTNDGLKERIRVMEQEREAVREETFKLRDKIKEKDCRRIETVLARKKDKLKDIQERNRRNRLREVSANQIGHTD